MKSNTLQIHASPTSRAQKPDTKETIPSGSVCRKVQSRQNQLIVFWAPE